MSLVEKLQQGVILTALENAVNLVEGIARFTTNPVDDWAVIVVRGIVSALRDAQTSDELKTKLIACVDDADTQCA